MIRRKKRKAFIVRDHVGTAVRRARHLGTDEVIRWIETGLYTIGRSLSESQKGWPEDQIDALLDEAQKEAEVIVGLLQYVRERRRQRVEEESVEPSLYT